MDLLQQMNELLSQGSDRVVYESGDPAPRQASGDGIAPAVLFVDNVTDAVKEVHDDRLVGSLNRDDLWEVARVELDREIIGGLSGDDLDLAGLVEVVRAAGYTWRVVEVSPSGP